MTAGEVGHDGQSAGLAREVDLRGGGLQLDADVVEVGVELAQIGDAQRAAECLAAVSKPAEISRERVVRWPSSYPFQMKAA